MFDGLVFNVRYSVSYFFQLKFSSNFYFIKALFKNRYFLLFLALKVQWQLRCTVMKIMLSGRPKYFFLYFLPIRRESFSLCIDIYLVEPIILLIKLPRT